MTGVLTVRVRRHRDTYEYKEEGHGKTEAETRVTHLQARVPRTAHRPLNCEGVKKRPRREPQRERGPADTRENQFLLLKATCFGIICNSGPRKPIYIIREKQNAAAPHLQGSTLTEAGHFRIVSPLRMGWGTEV